VREMQPGRIDRTNPLPSLFRLKPVAPSSSSLLLCYKLNFKKKKTLNRPLNPTRARTHR
jgi:hypothetical protein